jgi:hypothetical protein
MKLKLEDEVFRDPTGPTSRYIGTFGDNEVWEIEMPDGNRFRYSHGEMIPFFGNSEPACCGEAK